MPSFLTTIQVQPTVLTGVIAALVGLVAWWIRGIPERRRAADEGDGSMRKDLLDHIRRLEALRLDDRKQCALENEALRQRIKALEDQQHALLRDFLAYQAAIARLYPELGAIPLGHTEDVQGLENPLRALYEIPSDRPMGQSEGHKS